MPTVARDLCFRSSCFLAELAAILLASRRHTRAGEMRALLGLICHWFSPQRKRDTATPDEIVRRCCQMLGNARRLAIV